MARPKGSGVTPAHIRFEKFIMPEPNSGCWLWIGSPSTTGYGSFFISKEFKTASGNSRPIAAHVYSYQQMTGERVPERKDLCHKCDTRCCVNPMHLFVGIRKENMEDCKRKGRTAAKERNTNAKLTQKQGTQIWNKIQKKENSHNIAKEFGISWSTVHRIKKGTSCWRRK